MLQERLNNLAILSTESEEVKHLNFESTDEIAEQKERKVILFGLKIFWN